MIIVDSRIVNLRFSSCKRFQRPRASRDQSKKFKIIVTKSYNQCNFPNLILLSRKKVLPIFHISRIKTNHDIICFNNGLCSIHIIKIKPLFLGSQPVRSCGWIIAKLISNKNYDFPIFVPFNVRERFPSHWSTSSHFKSGEFPPRGITFAVNF